MYNYIVHYYGKGVDCFEQKNLNKLDKYDIIDITNDIHKKYL